MKKRVLIIIGILLIIYITYVTIDCIRLRNAVSETAPFITLSISEYENGNKYTGLGYSVKHYRDRQKIVNADDTVTIIERGYGAEFRLFDKILVWAWVE